MKKHQQLQRIQEDNNNDWVSSPSVVRTDKDLIVKDLFSIDNVDAYFGKGQIFNRTTFSGSVYSTSTSDYMVGITSLALAPTIGLPRPRLVGNGKTFRVKDEVGGASSTTITIISQGEETIDGATSCVIEKDYEGKGFYSDGSNWFTYLGSTDSSGVLTQIINMSAADIMGMFATPFVLVAGIANKILVPMDITATFTPGATAFTLGGNVRLLEETTGTLYSSVNLFSTTEIRGVVTVSKSSVVDGSIRTRVTAKGNTISNLSA